MLTDGLWIIVMFLSDSHSDGTHSLPLQRHISTNLMKKPNSEDFNIALKAVTANCNSAVIS